jgi:hypothetical protein
MQVNKVIETPQGAVEFAGEFSPEEVAFLLEFALSNLVMRGLLPLKVVNKEDMCSVQAGAGMAQ